MQNMHQVTYFALFFVIHECSSVAPSQKSNTITIGTFLNNQNVQTKIALETLLHNSNIKQNQIKYVLENHALNNSDGLQISKLLCNFTTGLGAIFSPVPPSLSSMVQSFSTNFEIPHFLMSFLPHSSNHFTTMNIFPSQMAFSSALASILRNLEWRNFIILYENDVGLRKMQEVLKLQSYSRLSSIQIRKLNDGRDNRLLLKEIRNSGINRIILDCETENIINVLTEAKEVGLMDSSSYNYFLTSLDAHTLDLSSFNGSVNFTTLRIFDPLQVSFQNTLKGWQDYSNLYYNNQLQFKPFSINTQTVLAVDILQLYIDSVNALHETQPIHQNPLNCTKNQIWRDGLRIISFMKVKSQTFSLSSPLAFDGLGRRNHFKIFIVEGNRENIVAEWNFTDPENLKFLRNHNASYHSLVKNMRKGVLVVSSRLGPPYLMERKPQFEGEALTGNDRYEGFSMDLIAAISEILGFKYKFQLTEDGKYGNYDPVTKTWNGLIKDLLDRKADLAICDLTITHQRREVVDFSMPFMTLGISILYKKAEEKNTSMFAFLAPFLPEIWIYTATLYLAVSIILYLVSRMAPGDWEKPHPCEEAPDHLENIWGFSNCFWLTLGSIMTQGCDILPKGISSRVVSSMWWFFSLIMTTTYTANLAAFLTMERMEAAIDSAEGLSKQTKVKYGTVEGGATQAFFRESNYSTYHKMWTTMVQAKPSVFEENNEDGVKRVQSTKYRRYAFLMESSQIEYEMQTKCDLKQVGNWLDSKSYGIAMPLDYPYRSAINTAILKLQEESKLKELKVKWWEKMRDQPLCPMKAPEKSSTELKLTDVGGVFIVLAIGVGLSFILAILEFVWNVHVESVEKRINFFEVIQTEAQFATNIWITKKRVLKSKHTDKK